VSTPLFLGVDGGGTGCRARVEDGGDAGELLDACARAHEALRLRVGASGERRFLASVVAHLTMAGAARAGSAHKIDGDRG